MLSYSRLIPEANRFILFKRTQLTFHPTNTISIAVKDNISYVRRLHDGIITIG